MTKGKTIAEEVTEYLQAASSARSDAAIKAIERVRDGVERGVRYPYSGAVGDQEAIERYQEVRNSILRFLEEAISEAKKAAAETA